MCPHIINVKSMNRAIFLIILNNSHLCFYVEPVVDEWWLVV